ncbi:O-antigen ligase family protein [Flavobacterium lacisediminis]|uniref:O-antigen ligase family protein n=1 Tax=Flavobacterium lacisediminis TaxID=2989705 RepID=A0ABT3EE95_9FLAO|nr:O-antigen ligase family protein [Flavobacterium lacisediminis]MCW1146899.1 O-antigen ligase family protein [Flavobacterium lacisediminis]
MIIFKRPIGYALKDIFHFIKPLQGILIGYFFYQIVDNKKVFFQALIKAASISAIIHIFIVLFFTNLSSGSIHEIREFTRDNYLELFALFFVLYYKFFFKEELFNSIINKKIIVTILSISCVLYFSRTMLVASLIILLSIYGYTKLTMKSVKLLSLMVMAILLFYTYLYSVTIDREARGLEGFLYKVKIAPSELFETKIDRENHKDLWDHWRGYEAKRAFALMNEKPISYLTGTGYGSVVNLKFKAPLDGGKKGMKYISELHNGYPYLLYKSGILALFSYLAFLFFMYKKIYMKFTFETVFISAMALFYFFTTLTITGIYNTNDTIIFVLGALFCGYFESRKKVES